MSPRWFLDTAINLGQILLAGAIAVAIPILILGGLGQIVLWILK